MPCAHRTAIQSFVFGSTIEAERHRSRTCLAPGYDAVLVLKTARVIGAMRHPQSDCTLPHVGARRPVRQSDACGIKRKDVRALKGACAH
jgi:hypothetical protein